MTNSQLHPRVGVGVLIIKDGKLLMAQRKGSHGSGTWAPPGGKLDFGEAVEDCAIRETLEETGVTVKDAQFITITNDITLEEDNHYITLWMKVKYVAGEPKITEPEKCEAIGWFSPDKLPSPLFLPMKNLLKANVKII